LKKLLKNIYKQYLQLIKKAIDKHIDLMYNNFCVTK